MAAQQYFLALDLKEDPALIAEYKAYHQNVWPEFNLELRPSGRPVRASAAKVFAQFAELAEKNPDDWHSWFNLSLAYDAAGDSRRARAAMRKAVGIHANAKSS